MSLKEERDELIKEKTNLESKIYSLDQNIEELKSNFTEALGIKESFAEELLAVREERDELKGERDKLRQEQSKLREECNEVGEKHGKLKKERDNLVLEIQTIQNRIIELNSASKSTNEEFSFLKKEHACLTSEKTNLQKEIERLQECLESNSENHSKSSETIMKLSHQISSLTDEKEDLIKEKSTLEKQSRKLENDLSICKEELGKISKEREQMSERLEILQKEHEDLILSQNVEQGNIYQMKSDLKQKEDMLLSINEKNKLFSEEMETLKSEYDHVETAYKSLQEKHDAIVAECESNKVLVSSLSEMKDKLSDELASLKKDNEQITDNLNKTKTNLEKELNKTDILKKELCSLSEELKMKNEESFEKNQESLCFKKEIEKHVEKINILNFSVEKLTKEKNVIVNYLMANINNVKGIKELLTSLYDFVKQFQVEINHEINDIHSKVDRDILIQLNSLPAPETNGSESAQVECKSKIDIDSYNSKLKNLQELSKISEEVLQVKATALGSVYSTENEPTCKVVNFSQMGHLENLSKQDCHNSQNSEAYLKQAISLMKSFTNLLNHNSVNSDYDVDLFTPDNEKNIRLSGIEGKNLQKEILAMELFITDCESRCYKNPPSGTTFQQNDSNKLTLPENSIEMQLKQEISLKDDIIKKLQSVIEDYEQKKDVDDGEFIYKQKVHMLEQENKSLTGKLKQLQETHELNVKNIISEYEKKLEDVEEESNLYDFEKLGKEKNYVVNEMKEQIQNLEQDLEERGDAFEKLYEEHQQNVKSFDEEVQRLRGNHDKELREQDKKWRQCLDRRLAEEETRHQQELASLNTQWNAERRELETARRLAVNAVESGSGSNELLRRQVTALTVQLTELRNSRCEACERKRKISDLGQDNRARSIQDCTEMEYLRNILYEYMMGKEPLVLAKVLCALVKFDENQTKEIVSKEEHRITLFGQLGLL